MLKSWGRVLLREPHRGLYGCRKFSYIVWLRKKTYCSHCRFLEALSASGLKISGALPPTTMKSLCPGRKCPCCNLQHPAIVTLHEKSVSTTHWSGKKQAAPLQHPLLQAEWSQSPQPLLTHYLCPSCFSGPLLDSRQFASIFPLELHLFCLSKAGVREDLKTWGLSKP